MENPPTDRSHAHPATEPILLRGPSREARERADAWIWNYFMDLRDDADLAAHAAGGTLPQEAFSYSREAEELPRLCRTVPGLEGADMAELLDTLHELDAAYSRFIAGTGGHPKSWTLSAGTT